MLPQSREAKILSFKGLLRVETQREMVVQPCLSQNHGIREWLKLVGALKIIQWMIHPLPQTGLQTTRSGSQESLAG